MLGNVEEEKNKLKRNLFNNKNKCLLLLCQKKSYKWMKFMLISRMKIIIQNQDN